MGLDDEIQAIQGKVAMRDTVESLGPKDQAILLVWRDEGRQHAMQLNCNTKATYCYMLGWFLHHEYGGRFDRPDDE